MQWSRRAFALLAWGALTIVLALAGCGASSVATAPAPTQTPPPTATTEPTATSGPSTPHVDIIQDRSGYYSSFAFSPATLTVKVGTTVTWLNTTQAPHTSTSDATPALWDSTPINPGGAFTFTFTRAGTYSYHCSIHPNMHGTIVVTA